MQWRWESISGNASTGVCASLGCEGPGLVKKWGEEVRQETEVEPGRPRQAQQIWPLRRANAKLSDILANIQVHEEFNISIHFNPSPSP